MPDEDLQEGVKEDRKGDAAEVQPETAPHPAPIFDTGPHPEPLSGPHATAWSLATGGNDFTGFMDASDLSKLPEWGSAVALAERDDDVTWIASDLGEDSSPSVPARSVVVPGQLRQLKWWKLLLALLAVWVPAAGIGLGIFYWWHQLLDKTPAVFVVLLYVVVCTVAGVMLAMVDDNPLISAFAIAVMTAVFASTMAAAPLYGHYFCQVRGPCIAGVVPY